MLLDADARIEFINKTAPGLTVEQVIGTRVYDYVPPSQHEMMADCFERVRATAQPDRYENVYTTPDGEVLLWESRVAPVMKGDEVAGFVVMASDVTEQRAAAIDRERFFELSLDLLCVAGLDGYFKRINPSFERVLGWTVAEMTAVPFVDFIHPDDAAATMEVLRAIGEGDVVRHFVNRYRSRDGGYRLFQWQAILDPQTQRVHALARDITEERAAQEQQLQSQKMEAIGQLAGGIAHDFNNLLLAVLANATFVRDLVDDASELVEPLEQIEAAGRRAAALTQQLLTLGRRSRLTAQTLSLGALTERTVEMLRRVIPENIEIVVDAAPDLPGVAGDPVQLEQVVLNLCVNARDAMPSGGTMRLVSRVVTIDDDDASGHPWVGAGQWVRLEVSDDGAGMSSEVRGRAFEPFFTTKPVGRGSGLGLATVYGIVEQHGGEIGVESEEGRGTSFFVYLPVAGAASRREVGEAGARRDEGGGDETILVAEDEALVRGVVARILRRRGYRVLEAVDGDDAVAVFAREPGAIDMALLDVVMPRRGGPSAYAEMIRERPDLPVLFTSGYAESTSAGDALPEGAVLLTKPYDELELLQRVRGVLDAAGSVQAPVDRTLTE